jgi:energy-coupling factor transporter ATP-binding protein EcfA2
MKIIELRAENVKKLKAVEIRPSGNLVEITGRNGQGKTSVLDSIWWALAGASHIQKAPIRKGAEEARIQLDLGEIRVKRTIRKKDDETDDTTTSLVVESLDGARFPQPQRMLDALIGELSFDPLGFTRMDAKAQFDTLKGFVPGVDFVAIERANKADYDKRTDLNRRAKEARTLADRIELPLDMPEAAVDEGALVAELERAGQHNADIEARKVNRANVAEKIAGFRQNAETMVTSLAQVLKNIQGRALARVGSIDAEIARLQDERAQVIAQSDEDAEDARRRTDSSAAALRDQADALQKRLDDAGDLPEPIDTAAVRAKIEEAKRANALVQLRAAREEHLKRAKQLEGESKALTAGMEAREEEKREAIAAAKLPVDGLGFGDGIVLFNDVPFNQASDAEQLRASIAIAMAMNPRLRVIRVRDGSLLDEDAMKLLGELADAEDYQVWIERVDSSGRVGVVLEDGRVKPPEPLPEGAVGKTVAAE